MKITIPYWIKWILCTFFGIHLRNDCGGYYDFNHCEVCGKEIGI